MAALTCQNQDNEFLQKVQNYRVTHFLNKYEVQHLTRIDGGEEDLDLEETSSERLLGLAEMFPSPVRNTSNRLMGYFHSLLRGVFRFTCNVSWFAFATSLMLFAPLVFEYERKRDNEQSNNNTNMVQAQLFHNEQCI